MKLAYWYAEHRNDADCYSIIAKTRKECVSQMTSDHLPPVKKVVEYADAFDLFFWATSEGGGRGCGVTQST